MHHFNGFYVMVLYAVAYKAVAIFVVTLSECHMGHNESKRVYSERSNVGISNEWMNKTRKQFNTV